LLRIVKGAKENVRSLVNQEAYMAHIYAMYLLAQFREERAYPLIADFFSLPGEITLELTGDMVTEDLGRILASVSGGDTSLMASLAENENVNEWVRGAALSGLVTLVARGEKDRQEIVAYFQDLFRGRLVREHSQVWNALTSLSTDLYAKELLGDIKQAYRDDLIEPFYIDPNYVEETLTRGKERTLKELRENRHYRLIEDTVRELEWWACFNPSPPRPIRPGRKIGRNEPCPCGSGKKYKRCCLRRQR
jgi:hypothetical protein